MSGEGQADILERIDELLELTYRSGDLGNLHGSLDVPVFIPLSQQTRNAVVWQWVVSLLTSTATAGMFSWLFKKVLGGPLDRALHGDLDAHKSRIFVAAAAAGRTAARSVVSGPGERVMNRAAVGTGERIAVELCAGLGGMGIGLRALGFHIAKAYDSWDEAVAIYNHNFGGEVAAVANLLSENGRRLLKADCRRSGDIELLAAGPPCKGFSQLRNGHHDGRNGHNRVLAVMPDYVAIVRPRLFVIENVPDLIRHRNGRTLADILERLERPAKRLRYRVDYRVYDAALFGTPQARRRILILGVRHGGGKEHLPEPGPDLAPLFAAVRHRGTVPQQLVEYLEALRDPEDATLTSSSQALSDLPLLGPGEPDAERPYASEAKSAFQRWVRTGAPRELRDTRTPAVNADTIKRLRHIPPGGCARLIPKEHLNGLSRRYDSAYRRLHPDAPSTALSTKYDCVYHYEEQRSLSVREYARLQGIPDRITFPSTVVCRRSAYEMIGNSVPPLLIERVLGEAIKGGKEDPEK